MDITTVSSTPRGFTIEYPLPPVSQEEYKTAEAQTITDPTFSRDAIDPSPNDPKTTTNKKRKTTTAAIRETASRIAQIHLLAMDSNPLLHAQFPTSESIEAVRRFLVGSYEETLLENENSCLLFDLGKERGGGSRSGSCEDGPSPSGGILIARETTELPLESGKDERKEEKGELIGFATWEYSPGTDGSSSPTAGPSDRGVGEDTDETQRTKPNNKLETDISNHVEGCRKEYLDEYARLSTQTKERCFGGQECYQLSFVCVDPIHQGKGIGSALTRKVLELAASSCSSRSGSRTTGIPVYLESTLLAVPMYRKLGFREIGSFEMDIPTTDETETLAGKTITYKEVCMVWDPSTHTE